MAIGIVQGAENDSSEIAVHVQAVPGFAVSHRHRKHLERRK